MPKKHRPAASRLRRHRMDSVLPARPVANPTDAIPGTDRKIQILMERADRREPLHQPGDTYDRDGLRRMMEQHPNGAWTVIPGSEIEQDSGEILTKVRGQTPAATILAFRQARKFSIRLLARRAGIDDKCVRNIEDGIRVPTLATLWRLARVLDTSIDHLAGRSA